MNLPTVIIALILVLIVGLIIFNMAKDKKQGKSSCGGNCSCCGLCGGGRGSAAKNAEQKK